MTGGEPASPGVVEGPDRDVDRVIVSAHADGIVAVDDAGIVRRCNPAAEVLFGRAADELVGSEFGFPLGAGHPTEIDLVLPGARRRVVEMRVATTTWAGERIHVAALRDVTSRRETERELEATLEQQTTVVGVAAHELRNPLAAIAALTYVLRDGWDRLSDADKLALVEKIAGRTEQLQALVRKLLTASRLDTGAARRSTPEAVPVLDLLLERLGDFGDRSEHLRLSCPPDVVAFAARSELWEMLANYIDNAFAYGHPPVEIDAATRAERVEIRVRDHGPGVPDTFVPRLFERFSREPLASRSSDGSGLGLWIVHGLARANGGDAWYEPAPDGGACFCLSLPRPS